MIVTGSALHRIGGRGTEWPRGRRSLHKYYWCKGSNLSCIVFRSAVKARAKFLVSLLPG